MEIIYNYLKNVFQDIKQETKQNPSFVCVLLILLTIPASLAVNNIALLALCASVFINFKKQNFGISKSVILLILLYLLMLFSVLWTIDMKETLKALPKEVALLLIPIIFFFSLNFTKEQKTKLFKYYSHGMVAWTFFWIIKAVVKYLITKDSSVFFYHELVTKEVNAIHVSIYVSIAFFYFLTKKKKNFIYLSILLFVFIILLSSKNIIVVVTVLVLLYVLFYSGLVRRMKLYYILAVTFSFIMALSFGRIKERFEMEIEKNFTYVSESKANKIEGVNTVNIAEAWKKEVFDPSDYFPGTALRVYKFRMFLELFQEDPVFWKGYGLNASKVKLREKADEYNLYVGYRDVNFHNQYVQNFAELGFFGFLLLLAIVILNLKKSIKSKDFLHIAFSILMISLFFDIIFLMEAKRSNVLRFNVLHF